MDTFLVTKNIFFFFIVIEWTVIPEMVRNELYCAYIFILLNFFFPIFIMMRDSITRMN